MERKKRYTSKEAPSSYLLEGKQSFSFSFKNSLILGVQRKNKQITRMRTNNASSRKWDRSFLPACCSLGPSGLNSEGFHIPFQGNRDAHPSSEKFKGFGALEIITRVLHFAEQAGELHKQLYFSLTIRVR